ncbi:MAG: TIR domain-containing protein [Actinomycetota bacterium]
MTTVFISYARADDRRVADEVQNWLAGAAFEVIRDDDVDAGVRPGRSWEQWLHRRVVGCDVVFFLLSERSIASRWCLSEIAIANALGIDMFPVIVDPAPSPDEIATFAGRILAVRWSDSGTKQKLIASLAEAGHEPLGALAPGASPYPGLSGFSREHQSVFTGRPQLVRDVVNEVTADPDDGYGVAVVGPSGVGKSSLVTAGVLPRLARTGRFAEISSILPSPDPCADLWGALGGEGARPAELVRSLADLVRARVQRNGETLQQLLFVDQAERLLTVAAPAAGEAFATAVRELMEEVDLKLLVTFRSEYLTHSRAAVLTELYLTKVDVDPMTRAERRLVIERPARRAGLVFEPPELVDRLLDDSSGSNSLPLLAYALQRLWELRTPDGELTEAAYLESGGVDRALVREADRALADAVRTARGDVIAFDGDEGRDAVLEVLTGFALPPQAGNPVASRDLVLTDANAAVLRPFVDRHLLQTEPLDGSTAVRVAHESFLTAWTPLSDAIALRADRIRFRREIELAAQTWASHDTPDDDELQYGGRLARARTAFPDPTAPIDAYLDASDRADTKRRQQRRNARLIRGLAVIASGLAVLSVVLAVRAIDREGDANEAAVVNEALRLTADADRLSGSALDQAARRAVAAFDAEPGLPATRGGLLDVLMQAPGPVAFVPEADIRATTAFVVDEEVWGASVRSGLVPLDGGTDPVRPDLEIAIVDLSPDGSRLAVAARGGRGNVVELLDVDTWTSSTEIEVTTPPRALAVTSRGSVAWIDEDDEVWWAGPDGAARRLGNVEGALRLASTERGCLAVATPTQLHLVADDDCSSASGVLLDQRVTALDAHPSEDRLIVARNDGEITELQLGGVQPELRTVALHGPGVEALQYSADGAEVFSGGTDRVLRAWITDAVSIPSRAPLHGHSGPVTSIGSNGTIAVSSSNGTNQLIVWDYRPERRDLAAAIETPEDLGGPIGLIRAWDGSVWVHGNQGVARWNGDGIGPVVGVVAARVSIIPDVDHERPDAAWVVVYDIPTGAITTIATVDGQDELTFASIPPNAAVDVISDERSLLATLVDGTVCLIEPDGSAAGCTRPSGAEEDAATCGTPANGPVAVAASPSGSLAAVGYVNGTVWVIDLDARARLGCRVDREGAGQVNRLQWLTDDRLAVADDLHPVWVLDASSAELSVVHELEAHSDSVIDLDRAGNVLASAGEDGTVRLWDVESGSPIGSLGLAYLRPTADDPEVRVEAVAALDDHRLLSVQRGALTMWDLSPESWRAAACALTGDTSETC